MGLILPQTVKIRIHSTTYKYYREKGYEFEKKGDFIEVNVLDLHPGSHEKVKIICDICGNESEIQYRRFVENRKNGVLVSCASNSCRNKKYEDTCTKKYGVNNPNKVQEVKDKIKDTNLERYGVKNAMQCKEIQDKAKDTNLERYGVKYPMQCKEIQDKVKDTNLGRYGAENPFGSKEIRDKIKDTWQENYGENITNPSQAEEVKEKIKDTNLERYGCIYVLQSEEIRNKILSSFQFNHTGPSSRAQRYINNILNGTLNKRICGLLVDIYMEKENIVIEHDGRGHFLGDMINGNKIPTKETILKEKRREDKIINNGYRMIRFIATKDRIPSDEVILNLVEGFKNSDFKVIRINFEEGTIDRDYEEKWYCNFGKLRKITKEDLEQFEKQEENTSEN